MEAIFFSSMGIALFLLGIHMHNALYSTDGFGRMLGNFGLLGLGSTTVFLAVVSVYIAIACISVAVFYAFILGLNWLLNRKRKIK